MESEFAKSHLEAFRSLALVRLAVISSKGDPLVVPLRFHFDGQAFYVGLPSDSPILMSIKANRRVALVGDSDGKGELEGAVVQGLAQTVRGQGEVDRAVMEMKEKYSDAGLGEDLVMVKVTPLRVLNLEGQPP